MNPRVLRGFYIYKVKKYGVNYDLLRPQSFSVSLPSESK